jgi:hypothetical protein
LSRFVDLIAKVATKEGEPELILIHVDIEHPWRSTFPYRMFEYYALLRLRHRLPVFPPNFSFKKKSLIKRNTEE